jgi:hypothetical protein
MGRLLVLDNSAASLAVIVSLAFAVCVSPVFMVIYMAKSMRPVPVLVHLATTVLRAVFLPQKFYAEILIDFVPVITPCPNLFLWDTIPSEEMCLLVLEFKLPIGDIMPFRDCCILVQLLLMDKSRACLHPAVLGDVLFRAITAP